MRKYILHIESNRVEHSIICGEVKLLGIAPRNEECYKSVPVFTSKMLLISNIIHS